MRLMKAIETADRLCPNPYGLEEKIRWCDEVTAALRRTVKKVYTTVETTVSEGHIEFPDNFAFEDLEIAYLNGCPMDKLDLRTLLCDRTDSRAGKLKLVFLEQPQPTRLIHIQGVFDLSENFITMENPPFEAGDVLMWTQLETADAEPDWENAQLCCVLDKVYDGLMMEDGAFEAQSQVPMALRRVINDETEVTDAPYDGMYVEYLLAKMALYQHDYESYGAHMAQYNTLFETLRREYKSRSALNPMAAFRRYW